MISLKACIGALSVGLLVLLSTTTAQATIVSDDLAKKFENGDGAVAVHFAPGISKADPRLVGFGSVDGQIGVLTVLAFAQGGRAASGGLQLGDTIIKIGPLYFASSEGMNRWIASRTPGSQMTVTIRRRVEGRLAEMEISLNITIDSASWVKRQPLLPSRLMTPWAFSAPSQPPSARPRGGADCDEADRRQSAVNSDVRSLTWDFPVVSLASLNCFVKQQTGCALAACAYLSAYSGQCGQYSRRAESIGQTQRSIDRRREANDCYARVKPVVD